MSRLAIAALAGLTLASLEPVALGTPLQDPIADDGFSPATPPPDHDLIIVRERSYGAGGVDLTAYGIGTGPVHFVQSIYFRLFKDNNLNTWASVAGRVVFPEGVEILGIVTDGTQLGGDVDDGILTKTDEHFAIGSDPDIYSETARGFESSGYEFVCQTTERAFVFGLLVTGGVDDFRVIVDYGDSFPADLGFDVSAYDLDTLEGIPPSLGYRIGNDLNPSAPGSGDYGEIESLLGIPLTGTDEPTIGCGIPVNPPRSVYLLRDTSADTQVDGFDVDLQLPAPGQFAIDGGVVGSPAAVTAGPDGLLYVLAQGTGYAVIDVRGGVTNELPIEDLPGSYVDLAWIPGERSLYVARDTGGDSHVDVFDVDGLAFVQDIPVPASFVGTPVGITNGDDGLLYVTGQGTGFASVDPVSGTVTNIGNPGLPGGTYVDITGRAGHPWIYLLRGTSPGSRVDVFDVTTQSFTHDFAISLHPSSPVGLSIGPDDRLYLLGGGGNLTTLDADTGMEAAPSNFCMDFVGENVDIAFTVPGPEGIYCEAKPNSQGCFAAISATGSASVSDPMPFLITCDQVLNNKNGILFYGYGPNSAPFQGGTLCVQGPIKRTPIQFSGGNPPPADCSGHFELDFNTWIQSGTDPGLEPCISVYAQYWYRDPQDPTGFTTGLSNALEFVIGL